MAIEAPVSKFRTNGLLIYIAVCLAASAWFAYDGYVNKTFIEEHTDENGKADSTLVFNQKAPPFGVGLAGLMVGYFFVIRKKKVVADEDELIINATEKIPYASIQKIDKTHFDSKGFFVVTYQGDGDKEVERKLSTRQYDNIRAVLDHLVGKIS